ncbi:MAG TPA: hypothetical protein DDY32_05900, partial [Desulfobulbaceae bacterium]|nr:hypothetical protein [Desulfobulbaceae bacterium]
IVVEPPATPIIAKNNPFLVQNLIWLCLESAFGATTAGGTLRLAAERNGGRSGLRICGIDGLTEDFAAQLPAVCADLLDASGAKLIVDSVKKDLNLILT